MMVLLMVMINDDNGDEDSTDFDCNDNGNDDNNCG